MKSHASARSPSPTPRPGRQALLLQRACLRCGREPERPIDRRLDRRAMSKRVDQRVPVALAALVTVIGDGGDRARPIHCRHSSGSWSSSRAWSADLEMTDHTGKRRRLSDLAGTPALVYFGFTHCPDACPTTLQKLAMIKSSRGEEPLKGVRVVLISVDGERDTPEVIEGFSRALFRGIRRAHRATRPGAQSGAELLGAVLQGSAEGRRLRGAALDACLCTRQARTAARRTVRASREATVGVARALLSRIGLAPKKAAPEGAA